MSWSEAGKHESQDVRIENSEDPCYSPREASTLDHRAVQWSWKATTCWLKCVLTRNERPFPTSLWRQNYNLNLYASCSWTKLVRHTFPITHQTVRRRNYSVGRYVKDWMVFKWSHKRKPSSNSYYNSNIQSRLKVSKAVELLVGYHVFRSKSWCHNYKYK